MIWLISAILISSLLNLLFSFIIFRAIVVTNEKIEEDVVYKKKLLDKVENVDDIPEVKKQQGIIIETLKRIVELL